MKKYLMIFSVLAFVACNNSQKMEDQAVETTQRENEVRQRTIDSMAAIKNEANHPVVHSTTEHHTNTTNSENSGVNEQTTEPTKRKGMSNTTKGALIGTGVGIVGGAVTGAATSEDKGKGAVTGGVIGGAVGSGVGYGIGAKKDKDIKDGKK